MATSEAPGVAGVDLAALRPWFAEHVAGFVPVAAAQIAGGHSNITVLLTDAEGNELVLRRPPLHTVLASAHDMGREYRLISAFVPTPLPVPRTLAYCADPTVIGAPFYVMEYVVGIVLNGMADAELLAVPARRQAAESFVDALVELHAADIDTIGLGDLAKREDYVARQLKRWQGQYQKSRARPDDRIDRAHDLLAARIPEQREATVVHGDFRLGNCIVSAEGDVRAVLDWEICTLGDPLADVGYVVAMWPVSELERRAVPDNPVTAPGFPKREELLERYAERTGRDLSHAPFYVAFSYYRLACILHGVLARALGGAQGQIDDDGTVRWLRTSLDASAELAYEQARAL